MMAFLGSVLAASLVGSLHCAGMCGPLVVFCGGGQRPQPRELAAYHGARLFGYVVLGLLAGALGAAVDLGGNAAGVGRTAALLAGGFMIVAGLGGLLGKRRGKPGKANLLVTRLMGKASRMGSLQRSLVIGGLTALLPCGWLYAFLAAAAGTGSVAAGALVMGLFWLGSVPVLLGIGVGAGSLLAPLRARAPAVVALLLVTIGVFTAVGRFGAPSFQAAGGDTWAAEAIAGELDQEQLPCCSSEEAHSEH